MVVYHGTVQLLFLIIYIIGSLPWQAFLWSRMVARSSEDVYVWWTCGVEVLYLCEICVCEEC